jgi:hypothetical protein
MRQVTVLVAGVFAVGTAAHAGISIEALGGSYGWETSVDLVRCIDLKDGIFILTGRYYFEPVDNSEEPYRLQPFLQASSYAELALEFGPGDASLLDARALYVFPETPVGVAATLGFGSPVAGESGSLFAASAGGIFYVMADNKLAAEVSIGGEQWEIRQGAGPPPKPLVTINVTTFSVGARYVISVPNTGVPIEVYGGFRSIDVDGAKESGLAVEARYFFSKDIFAGFEFSGETDRFSVSGGYAIKGSFELEAELGIDDALGGDFVRFGAMMRF